MDSKDINRTKSLNFAQLLNNIPSAILLIDKDYNISFINYSAEVLLGESSKTILNNNLQTFLALDNQLFSLIDQVNRQRYNATQFDITINDFNKRNFIVDVEAGIYDIDHIILCFHKRAIAEQIDRSIVYKNIHSVSGLSSFSLLNIFPNGHIGILFFLQKELALYISVWTSSKNTFWFSLSGIK